MKDGTFLQKLVISLQDCTVSPPNN